MEQKNERLDKPRNQLKNFKDIRHSKRLGKILKVLSEHPEETIPQASKNDSESQSIYRFWSNERVEESEILASHRQGVVKRCIEAEVVLAIQDTTDLEYTTHEATKGLGYIKMSYWWKRWTNPLMVAHPFVGYC